MHKDTNEASVTPVLRFLQDDLRVAYVSGVRGRPGFSGGMHWTAFFGLDKIIERQLDIVVDKDPRDDRRQTPLSIAAERMQGVWGCCSNDRISR
jgi:hypothetical protein